ncbi:enoyl-CoA hydratase/isomerase domain protein [Leptospira interrogans serovar Bataviae str. HAI135]|nr:enoyl-CoA hydratase/isomerase domain protein [Leptospira interrogans serovar Bataviae str. HAI135]
MDRPVVCAMNGHSMGLGAVFAIFSDYRIMVEKREDSVFQNHR